MALRSEHAFMNTGMNVASEALARSDASLSRLNDGKSFGECNKCLTYVSNPRCFGPVSTRSMIFGTLTSRSSSTADTDIQATFLSVDAIAMACDFVSKAVPPTTSPSHRFAPDVVANAEIVTIGPR